MTVLPTPKYPSHQADNAILYTADCLQVMADLPASSVDMVFADPPYNLSNDGTTVHAGRRVSVNKGGWDRSQGVEADFEFHSAWIDACRRLLKPDGTLWVSGTHHSIFACGHALQLLGFRVLSDIAWYKQNPPPNLGRRMFTAAHETLIWASRSAKSRHTFNYDAMRDGYFRGDMLKNPGKQMHSVWAITPPAAWEKRYGKHPTQKPEALLSRIVRASTSPGDLVFDPFAGSCTTGVVALRHGRYFIGIEQDSEYCERLAVPRLNDEATTLFTI